MLTKEAVAEALVRYINQGITLNSVNLPEVNLRSLTLDEPDHARVRIEPGRILHWKFIDTDVRSSTFTATFRVSCAEVSDEFASSWTKANFR